MESATQLLESAGYTKHSDGYYFHMSLLVVSDGTYADGAKVIKTQLAQIGVGATIEELEEALGCKRCSAATMICAFWLVPKATIPTSSPTVWVQTVASTFLSTPTKKSIVC